MESQVAAGVSRTWAVHRSVTLLRVFLMASAAILFVGAILLGSVLTASLRWQALEDSRTSLTQYVDGVLRPQLVRGDRIHVSPHLPLQIKAQLRRQPDLLTVKVWRPDGVLVWTNRAPERIGRKFALEGDLGETIRENHATASIGELGEDEDAAETALGLDHVFEVYAPLLSADGRRALGAYEIYAKPQHTEMFIASRKRVIWLAVFAVFAVFAVLYAALALLVRTASSTLRRQSSTLQAPFTRAHGLLPTPGGELARGDREPQRDGGQEGPVHRRPFGTGAARRARRRGGARHTAGALRCRAIRRAVP